MNATGTGNRWAAGLVVGVFFSTSLIAQDQPLSDPSLPPSEELLPQPVTEGHFEPVLKNSPFLRTLNLSETYALRGVAEIDGVSVATLYNRHSKKTIYVTPEEANEQGMKLVEVVPAQDLTGVMARIAFGGEELELKFENDRVAPQPKGSGRSSGGGDSGKDGERKGPSKEDMDRYNSLSEAKKEQLRNFIRGTMQKYPEMSREDRGNLIRGAMQKLSDGRDIEIPSGPQPSGGGDGGDRGSSGGDRGSGGGDRGSSGGDRGSSGGDRGSGGGDRR